MKAVKLELHRWLERNVLNSWGKEAIYVAYRKVSDVIEKAEKKSKEGIQFLTADETPEDKLRRIIGELQEIRDEVPTVILEKVLDENGLILKTTAEEARQAMEAADAIERERVDREKAEAKAAQAAQSVAVSTPPSTEVPSPETPSADIMRNRQPLNTAPVDIQRAPTRQAPNVVPASRQAAPPPPQDAVSSHAIQGPPVVGSAALRAAQMAALETDADQVGALGADPVAGFDPTLRPAQVPMLEHRQQPGDPKAAAQIIDQPPRVGLNPHFRSPRRA
jgi:hypothetical protein